MKENIDNKEFQNVESLLTEFYNDKEDAKLKAAWAQKLKDKHHATRVHKSSKLNPLLFIIVTALLLSIAAGYYFLQSKSSQKQAPSPELYIAQLSVQSDLRYDHRGEVEEKNLAAIAYSQVKEQTYQQALDTYQKIESQNLNSFDKYHQALAFIKNQNNTDAIIKLESLKLDDQTYLQECNWLLSLAYLETGQVDKAEPILNFIISNNHYKNQEASILKTQFFNR